MREQFPHPVLVFIQKALDVIVVLRQHFAGDQPAGDRILHGIMVVIDRHAEVVEDGRQAVIVQIQHALRHFAGTEKFILHLRQFVGFDRLLQAAHVELGKVRHERVCPDEGTDVRIKFVEGRFPGDHGLGDAVDLDIPAAEILARIDERVIAVDFLAVGKAAQADGTDAVTTAVCSFKVNGDVIHLHTYSFWLFIE
ncbi:hypothetical protein SDC9_182996 [bioreactor metagenome]|uniref:Uncharacterized protein n=1 Tax=bioreactor metagenome TaxID=1076179 RepID=A0A645H942_9ZZZZ